MSRGITLKKISTEAKLLLIGIPVFLWTIIPVYHLVLFAISPKDLATTGQLWPKNPTWQNFDNLFIMKYTSGNTAGSATTIEAIARSTWSSRR